MDRRLVELFRVRAELMARLAQVDAELAAVAAEGEPANDASPAAPPKKTKGPAITLADKPPSDLGQKRATAILRKLGYRVK